MRKTIVAGNWKMNKTPAQTSEFIKELAPAVAGAKAEVIACVPFVCLSAAIDAAKGTNIKIGAQNLHFEDSGAYTGEVSADMLTSMGVEYVIIGHSERRQYFAETDVTVNKKLIKALEKGLKPIVCVGESLEEREQGITIDVAYRYFSTNNRKFIIADTPGHEQYTRNMITGGSTANLAIILVDARTGVITQTRRHTYLVSLLGIKHVVLAVNKMDLVDFDKQIFDKIVSDYKDFVSSLNIPDITCIPLSALDGDNVVDKSERTPWYEGPALLDFLENVPIDQDRNFGDFRYPVQYVLRPNLDFRGFSGKVASGIVRKGDTVMALPSGKTSKVKSIVTYEGELDYAFPPQCVTITLEDEIDVSRGEMLVHPDNLPISDRNFEAMLVWMDEEPMDVNKQFYIKHTSNLTRARIDTIRYKVNVNTMEQLSVENGLLTADTLPMKLNEIGRVVFTTGKELFFDPYQKNRQTGAFILIDPITNNTSAVGMIIDRIDARDMVTDDALAVLNLPELGIGAEHYEAIRTICKELERQGVSVKCITENR